MGISISGSNAISGLSGNDTDFDKVLSQLKKIESTQLNRLEAWKSDWKLRYDAFTQIIDQIQAASSMLSQISDKNNFVTKLVQSTNEGVVTAVANASAQDVQHSIKVSQVASNAIWANTGHVFDSKNEIINTTGTEQYFNYSYGGKQYSFKVPANTTLDSFASMINNSADNPGIKVSLIQTGSGYVFQVAGTSTGVNNDLIIHDSNLVGMSATGSTSVWQSNSSLDTSEILTNPTSYVFDLVLQGGARKSVTIKGSATPDELAAALNNAAGINASVDSNGKLTIEGVQSFNVRKATEDAYVPEGLRVSLDGGDVKAKLNDTGGIAAGLGDNDPVDITITLADGNTRTVSITAGSTQRDFLAALVQATQSGSSVDIGSENNKWGVNLTGVKAIAISSPAGLTLDPGKLTSDPVAGKGTLNNFGSQLTATTTLTFNKDKLSQRIDGKTDPDGTNVETLIFTLIREDGTATNLQISSGATNQDLLDAIAAEMGISPGADSDGNSTLDLAGIKELRLSSGSVKEPAWSSGLKSSVTTANTLFVENGGAGSGDYRLEEDPPLVYTFKTNGGLTGTLTMPSGSSMKEVLAAIKDPTASGWTWVDSNNEPPTPATPPADWDVSFTDEDGNEHANPVDGKLTVNIKNAHSITGPGISGQIASSSNWNIQKAANARYQVDNWPIEMESDTNSVTDVIEGVVFSIQDVGEARISVSTDITSVEQSIQNFLDAVNSVLMTVNDLMKYDETKDVTSNDPDDIGNENYSASGLTNQKGNLLTGNYGTQLFKSRFSSLLGSTPPGFQSRQSANDLLSGDVLASLANLGIKTDTDTTSDTYGLLVMAPSSGIAAIQDMDKSNYNDMITNHLEAVVDFFCASGSGASTSTDFRYSSHIEGITKAGSYDVTYHVDDKGNITNVMVGGEPAIRDESMPGNYYSVASGDPRGLAILIDDLTAGDHPPAGKAAMQVRIKQGLVQTTNEFLKSELVFNDVNIPANATQQEIDDAIALKSKNGALMSLRDNYKTVMESIDVKIEREQRRLATWEARQKAIFANLETLLSQYGEQQKTLESQLKQLSGD